MSNSDQEQRERDRVTSFVATLSAANISAVISYASVGMNGLMLGNGGAITALIALKDGADLERFSGPVILFFLGFICAILCTFFSYISQGYGTSSLFKTEYVESKKLENTGDIWRKWAIGIAFFSLGFFTLGGALTFWIAIH